VEVTIFPQTKNSVGSSLQCEGNVDLEGGVDGILHREFVSPGQTINQQFYMNVVK